MNTVVQAAQAKTLGWLTTVLYEKPDGGLGQDWTRDDLDYQRECYEMAAKTEIWEIVKAAAQ